MGCRRWNLESALLSMEQEAVAKPQQTTSFAGWILDGDGFACTRGDAGVSDGL